MNHWMRPLNQSTDVHVQTEAYREGYRAYLSWECNGGDKPENPYWCGDQDQESSFHEQWQQGWDAAAWDS